MSDKAGRNSSKVGYSYQNNNSEKESTTSPPNEQVKEANKKRAIASHRYDSYRTAFYGSPAEKEAYK
jgi:hypothetical protein